VVRRGLCSQICDGGVPGNEVKQPRDQITSRHVQVSALKDKRVNVIGYQRMKQVGTAPIL
jgi:hypothetical protein